MSIAWAFEVLLVFSIAPVFDNPGSICIAIRFESSSHIQYRSRPRIVWCSVMIH